MASFLEGEKILNTDDKKGKKENNGQNECIGQNEQTGICISPNANQHHCKKLCNMNVMGSLGTKRLDQLLVKILNKNANMPLRGTIGTAGYDLCSA